MRRRVTKICKKCGAAYVEYEGGFVPKANFSNDRVCPKCKIKEITKIFKK